MQAGQQANPEKGQGSSAAAFRRVFGRGPEARVRAPGRINLIGEHVDYLEGLVMPTAIDRGIEASAARIGEPEARVWTEMAGAGGAPAVFRLDELAPRSGEDSWLNYLVGVLALLQDAGVSSPGFEIALTSDLPLGAGLSSSAALETATALVVEALTGVEQDPVDRALLCQKAEHDFAGVPCGIMDQLAVGASREGHALMIDCRDLSLTPVPLPSGIALVVADSGVKHALADGHYRDRREDCETAAKLLGVRTLRDADLGLVEASEEWLGDRLFRRARHAVTEIERVRTFAAAMEKGDLAKVGEVMLAGHESLRDDFEVSCPELDTLVEAACEFGSERGLVGARMTGGGFGGSAVHLVRADAAGELVDWLQRAYESRHDRPLQAFVTRAVDGAGILSPPAFST